MSATAKEAFAGRDGDHPLHQHSIFSTLDQRVTMRISWNGGYNYCEGKIRNLNIYFDGEKRFVAPLSNTRSRPQSLVMTNTKNGTKVDCLRFNDLDMLATRLTFKLEVDYLSELCEFEITPNTNALKAGKNYVLEIVQETQVEKTHKTIYETLDTYTESIRYRSMVRPITATLVKKPMDAPLFETPAP